MCYGLLRTRSGSNCTNCRHLPLAALLHNLIFQYYIHMFTCPIIYEPAATCQVTNGKVWGQSKPCVLCSFGFTTALKVFTLLWVFLGACHHITVIMLLCAYMDSSLTSRRGFKMLLFCFVKCSLRSASIQKDETWGVRRTIEKDLCPLSC